MSQPFPQVGSPLVDTKTGAVTPVWRALFAALWTNQGGAQNTLAAPAGGNANQPFNVATATGASNAVPLAQAEELFAPVGGSQTQQFYVGNAPLGSNYALRRAQADGLFMAFGVAGAAIVPVTVTASPFTYTATTAGTLFMQGGTVSAVSLTRSGTTIPATVAATPVRAGDAVTITYTVAPTVNFAPA
jgi:hypothetical protein